MYIYMFFFILLYNINDEHKKTNPLNDSKVCSTIIFILGKNVSHAK